ncbi:hypothetical protein GYH30_052129, partial [Glycine max]
TDLVGNAIYRDRTRSNSKQFTSKRNPFVFPKINRILKTKLAWITSRQIEAGQRAMSRNVRRGGQIWVHIFPDKPVIVRPTETCMGSGFQLLKYVVPNTDKFVPFVMTQ